MLGMSVMAWPTAIIATAMLLLSRPVSAGGEVCAPHQAMLSALSERFHERPVAFQLLPTGQGPLLIEVLMAPDWATGTVIQTDARGRSCILLALSPIGAPA